MNGAGAGHGVRHLKGWTYHGRKGALKNAFRYSIDYVMLDAEAEVSEPALFSRNHRNVAALTDADHGGVPGEGRGAIWVREVLSEAGITAPGRIDLLAQPRMLGHVFNPVSFWLCHDAQGALIAVIAEVSNTFRDRHSYLCHRDDMRPIQPEDTLEAAKVFHVSPFQDVGGAYRFRFDIRDDSLSIRIDFTHGDDGLIATLDGPLVPLTNAGILGALLRRPFGSRRVLGLIHWQALKLWWKGAAYRPRPEPPRDQVSR